MTETNDDGTTPKTFTQEQVNAFAADARKDAATKAQAQFLEATGAESIDALKALVDSQADVAAKLSELDTFKGQIDSLTAANEAAQKSLTDLFDAQVAEIPEAKRGMIPEYEDVTKKLDWLVKNRSHLTTPATPPPPPGFKPGDQGAGGEMTYAEFCGSSVTKLYALQKENPVLHAKYSAMIARGEKPSTAK